MTAILLAQLSDPFRIVMLVALVYVWHRNRAVTPGPLPLLAGWAFVAALLPLTTASGAPLVPAIGLGLVSNAVILAVVLGVWTLIQRRRGG
jgi:hypothetical protein